MKICRVRILARPAGGGEVETLLDVRSIFAWRGGHWWTETRHGEWVVHRIYIEDERVLISRMSARAEPAQNYSVPRRR